MKFLNKLTFILVLLSIFVLSNTLSRKSKNKRHHSKSNKSQRKLKNKSYKRGEDNIVYPEIINKDGKCDQKNLSEALNIFTKQKPSNLLCCPSLDTDFQNLIKQSEKSEFLDDAIRDMEKLKKKNIANIPVDFPANKNFNLLLSISKETKYTKHLDEKCD